MDKNELDGVLTKSDALAAQGRVDEAIAVLTDALGLDLDRTSAARVHALRGNRQFHAQRFEEALSDFLSALDRRPDAPTTRFYVARALMELGREGEALEQFEWCDKVQPGRVDTLLWMAYLRVRSGELVRAKADVEQALAIEPGNVEALFRLGVVLVGLDLPDDALVQFESIAPSELGEFAAEYHYNRGVCHEDMGNLAAAHAEYRKALGIDPTNEDAAAGLLATGNRRGGRQKKRHRQTEN